MSSPELASWQTFSNSRIRFPRRPRTAAYSLARPPWPASWNAAKTCAHCVVFVSSSPANSTPELEDDDAVSTPVAASAAEAMATAAATGSPPPTCAMLLPAAAFGSAARRAANEGDEGVAWGDAGPGWATLTCDAGGLTLPAGKGAMGAGVHALTNPTATGPADELADVASTAFGLAASETTPIFPIDEGAAVLPTFSSGGTTSMFPSTASRFKQAPTSASTRISDADEARAAVRLDTTSWCGPVTNEESTAEKACATSGTSLSASPLDFNWFSKSAIHAPKSGAWLEG
mmetsp:Transcript_60835/g.199188  ORF Transcript_60835/g.199188 Transcript_60835/m.199188 type:complete len:289 (+) Transcript_60835:809-1675(+)